MTKRSLLFPLAALCTLGLLAGCNSQPQGQALSKEDEARLKAPPGSNPMPPEARAAMQNAGRAPGGGAPPGPGGGR